MIYMYYAVLILLAFAPVAQRIIDVRKQKQSRKEMLVEQYPLDITYSDDVLELSDKRMDDIIDGRIKKHLSPNTSEKYNSNQELLSFQKFLNGRSSLRLVASTVEEMRYNG